VAAAPCRRALLQRRGGAAAAARQQRALVRAVVDDEDTAASEEEVAAAPVPEAAEDASAAEGVASASAATEPVAVDEAEADWGAINKQEEPPAQEKRRKKRAGAPEVGDIIPSVPFDVGDVVQGKVVFSNDNGARVEVLCGQPGVIGYMKFGAGPHSINAVERDFSDAGPFRIPRGLVRDFHVVNIPDEMRENGVGPLLSAKALDDKLLWRRLAQMKDSSRTNSAVYSVEVSGANKGGVRSRLQGQGLFIPYSFLPKCPGAPRWSEEEALKEYAGKSIEVAVTELDPSQGRLVGSMKEANAIRTLRIVYPGALVSGTVRRVEDFGCFVGIDGTSMSALLHISNISNGHLDFVENVLAVGDRVCCVITEMQEGGRRVSLSTRELESYKGEMLRDAEGVFATADERYQQYLADCEAGYY